jgi:nucleoid-associated protein YejK
MQNTKQNPTPSKLPTLEQARKEVLKARHNTNRGLRTFFSNPFVQELYTLHAADYQLDLQEHWSVNFKRSYEHLKAQIQNGEEIHLSKITANHIDKRNAANIGDYMDHSDNQLYQHAARVRNLLRVKRALR